MKSLPPPEVSAYLSKLGRVGGRRRAESLTPERRKEIATKASHSRKIVLRKAKG